MNVASRKVWFYWFSPALLLMTACDQGLTSRFDEVAGVDVCQLITPAEAEHILGRIQSRSSTPTTGSGFAGNCTWKFNSLPNSSQASLFVNMMTRASSSRLNSPAEFMRISQDELEASLGANPWPMEDLGDKTLLYQTRKADFSEMWMLQSGTLLMMRIDGGSAAQLEEIARAFSRELLIKDDGA